MSGEAWPVKEKAGQRKDLCPAQLMTIFQVQPAKPAKMPQKSPWKGREKSESLCWSSQV